MDVAFREITFLLFWILFTTFFYDKLNNWSFPTGSRICIRRRVLNDDWCLISQDQQHLLIVLHFGKSSDQRSMEVFAALSIWTELLREAFSSVYFFFYLFLYRCLITLLLKMVQFKEVTLKNYVQHK